MIRFPSLFTPCGLAAALAALLVLAALCAAPANAQFAMPSPDQPDMPVDAKFRAATVESLATVLERRYVFHDVARKTANALRARVKKGAYEGLDGAKAFADSLSADFRSIGKDRHFRVGYWSRELPEGDPKAPSPEEKALEALQMRRMNYGFERVQRLSGNIGYLDLRMFVATPEAGACAQAAMALLANSDALIVDLRRNGGGDPNLLGMLISWLYDGDERVHINDFYLRDGDMTEQYWTNTAQPGPRYAKKPMWVLTSHRTGSCAEEFAYDIKNLKRGTLVGETTAGAANPGSAVRLNAHFAAFVPTGRAVNPVSKTNWEGVGVEPDVKTSADDAFKTAQLAALDALIAQEKDADRVAALQHARQMAQGAPVEPLDLGMPRMATQTK
jgi:hypothetical protein